MKRKTVRSELLLWIGIFLCCCPLLIGFYNQNQTKSVLATYEKTVEKTDTAQRERLKKQAEEYNELLWKETAGIGEREQKKEELKEQYADLLSLGMTENKMIGVLEIPVISLRLPVYHGTEESVLKEGAGHLEGSSLPVGGQNTHSVLTGHRGLASARLFTRLDELEKGNCFYLEVLGEKLEYEVSEIRVIRPDETRCLEIRDGEDLVSLVTCTPYGINTHRLVVTGKRVPEKTEREKEQKRKIPSFRELLFMLLPLCFLGCVVIEKIKRRRERRNCETKKRKTKKRRKRKKRKKKSDISSAAFRPAYDRNLSSGSSGNGNREHRNRSGRHRGKHSKRRNYLSIF